MKAQDKSGPQWDPEVAAAFADETSEPVAVAGAARDDGEGFDYRRAAERVKRRIPKARELTCDPLPTPDAYHVEGGTDLDGHTVDLRADWGHRCTCGSHMMNFEFCKHLMRVGLERDESFSDRATVASGGRVVPGLFSQAMEVEKEKAAHRAAKGAGNG
jgi:hypothetical protein